MEWINIHAPTLRAPEYIGSEPIARATWLNLMAYCCEQENGGRIVGGALWKDRQWQQTCGVTRDEILNAAPLLVVDGDDIVVWRYPAEKEAEVRRKREGGARGGHAQSEAKRLAARANGAKGGRQTETQAEPKLNPSSTEAGTQRKGMEGKGTHTPLSGAEEEFVEAWNKLPEPFPRIRAMSSARKTHLRSRLRDSFWRDNWLVALTFMPGIPFLAGRGERGWVADVDFFLRPDTVAKIIEGKYRAAPPSAGVPGTAGAPFL